MTQPKRRKRRAEGLLSNKIVRLSILLVLIFILGVSLTIMVYSFIMVEDSRMVPYSFIVDEYVGLKADNDAFYFGAIQPTGSSKREFFVTSERIVRVYISATGEGSEWISVSENAFLLEPGEPKQLFLYVHIPADATLKEYDGRISLLFLRPQFFFSPRENLLETQE